MKKNTKITIGTTAKSLKNLLTMKKARLSTLVKIASILIRQKLIQKDTTGAIGRKLVIRNISELVLAETPKQKHTTGIAVL